jgi:hypothetical protein
MKRINFLFKHMWGHTLFISIWLLLTKLSVKPFGYNEIFTSLALIGFLLVIQWYYWLFRYNKFYNKWNLDKER